MRRIWEQHAISRSFMNRKKVFTILAILFLPTVFLLNLFVGTVDIPASDVLNILLGRQSSRSSWQYIVLESRLPEALVAMLCGGCLSVSGLLLQALFRNSLAGPGIFGISSGASLGVAVVVLALGGSIGIGTYSFTGMLATLFSAFFGALLVTLILYLMSWRVSENSMLLIVGVMVGYLVSSLVAILNLLATEEGLRQFLIWSLGSFSCVPMTYIPLFTIASAIGFLMSIMLIKPLNILLLGEKYAVSIGINVRRVRNVMLVSTGVLTSAATAFCGPIAFIGLAVPHLVRLLLKSDDHRWLLPVTMLYGYLLALLCNLLCMCLPGGWVLPINAITPLIGAPVIFYELTRKGKE